MIADVKEVIQVEIELNKNDIRRLLKGDDISERITCALKIKKGEAFDYEKMEKPVHVNIYCSDPDVTTEGK